MPNYKLRAARPTINHITFRFVQKWFKLDWNLISSEIDTKAGMDVRAPVTPSLHTRWAKNSLSFLECTRKSAKSILFLILSSAHHPQSQVLEKALHDDRIKNLNAIWGMFCTVFFKLRIPGSVRDVYKLETIIYCSYTVSYPIISNKVHNFVTIVKRLKLHGNERYIT